MLSFRLPLNMLAPRGLCSFENLTALHMGLESGASRIRGKELACWCVQLVFVEHRGSTAFVGVGAICYQLQRLVAP